jgi:nucleotide-binding universal stress UspA family protein
MKTLLVPLDFSDSTTRILAKSVELAHELSAKLILLHVLEPVANYVPVGATMDVIAALPPVRDEEEDLANIEHRLKALADPIRATGLEVDESVVVGLAVDDIIDQAKVGAADFIILGSHGHGALYHLFGGSVVTGVLKRSPCPVIVIPAQKPK